MTVPVAPPRISTSIAPDEAARLVEMLEFVGPKARVLEVGAWRGYSTVLLAQRAAEVWSCDWHRGDPHAGFEDSLPTLWANLTLYGVRDRVTLLVGDADTALPALEASQFDAAFVDGFHSYEATLRNLDDVFRLVKVGAPVAVHDYGDARFAVTEAVDALLPRLHPRRRLERVRNLAVLVDPKMRPAKRIPEDAWPSPGYLTGDPGPGGPGSE